MRSNGQNNKYKNEKKSKKKNSDTDGKEEVGEKDNCMQSILLRKSLKKVKKKKESHIMMGMQELSKWDIERGEKSISESLKREMIRRMINVIRVIRNINENIWVDLLRQCWYLSKNCSIRKIITLAISSA